MSSFHKHRVHLLAVGYARCYSVECGTIIPNEIMELLVLWVKYKPFLIFNQICNAPRFQMEVHLDAFSSKIFLNEMIIGQYEIKYIEYNDCNLDIKQFINHNKSMINTVCNTNIYKTHFLSFIEINKIGSQYGSDYLIKIIAKQKKYDKIICESKWIQLKIGYPFLRITNHNKQECGQYFEEYIDINNKGNITMDEWLLFCSHSQIELDLIDRKRAYHFMEYLAKKDNNDNNDKIGIDKVVFAKLVCHHYYNMYLDNFRALIDTFKDKMVESASDIDDDYIFVYNTSQ